MTDILPADNPMRAMTDLELAVHRQNRKRDAARDRFINALRILFSTDEGDMKGAGIDSIRDTWPLFRRSPFEWFIRASDEDAAKMWQLIEARQPKEPT